MLELPPVFTPEMTDVNGACAAAVDIALARRQSVMMREAWCERVPSVGRCMTALLREWSMVCGGRGMIRPRRRGARGLRLGSRVRDNLPRRAEGDERVEERHPCGCVLD